ncbi:MAG: 30S ribosomal protein S20 [Acidimicrobiaceae bacterium]|nr:30S ribosomal protein S20 [Acidimicrobiaceae bacterium]MXW61680.1 30S ribosomal protein S20 [Acidimicrobiaceae bacterium]MXW77142.1 30S ribosomal protein S20 [Acidimicrobiaceae bacterium]MYA73983.1 30S ribosomal protein S20 [Acidimicrobiaceae bacterium]MYC42738.1 30S ribosomal protein S20 [Acidimicrobiaceae bacterium]
MANIKSQIKRNRQNLKRNQRNRSVRSEINTRTRTALDAIDDDAPDSEEAVRLAVQRIDKAAQKGVIHKNTAARNKSRLVRKLNG